MANEQIGLQQAVDDGFLQLWHWSSTVIKQIRNRMETQNVWPMGYPGPYAMYRYQNTKREKSGGWYSTGKSYNSLYATVYDAAGGSTQRIIFFFNVYMQFVDMGVGSGTVAKPGNVTEKSKNVVERDSKATYNKLYAKWGVPKVLRDKGMVDHTSSRRHRPFLMMEIRHQLSRLNEMLQEYYGEFMQAQVIKYLDDKGNIDAR